jgi:predicted transcriptional regulator
LTKAQQDGILAAIDEADRGETFAMENVLKELRKKYE